MTVGPVVAGLRRSSWRALVVAAAIGASAPVAALAQAVAAPSSPQAGDIHNQPFVLGNVLRVVARSLGPEPIVGTVDSLRGDVVVLDTIKPRGGGGLFNSGIVPVDAFRYVAVRASDLRTVDLRTGTSRSGGAVSSGLWGALIGGTILGVGNLPQRNPGLGDFVGGFAVGAALGGGIGVLVGSYNGREHWQRISGPYYLSAPTP